MGGKMRTEQDTRRLVEQQLAATVGGLAVLIQAHRLGMAGRLPLWVMLVEMVLVVVCSNELLHRWLAGGDLRRRLWPRVVANMLVLTPVCYLFGWGSLLGGVWIIVALLHITWSGSAAWFPSAVGSAMSILLGELGIVIGVFPSYLPSSQAHLMGAIQGFYVVLVLIFFGQLVAARERAEAALASEERRFRKMLTNSSDVVMLTDAAGAIEWISPSVRHQFGQEPDDLIGTPAQRLLSPDDDQVVARMAARMAVRMADDPASAHRVELRCRTADGSVRWHELVVQNLLDDPDVHGVVINQRDVTEASLAREQLRHQATHDGLTDLANRVRFSSELEDLLQRKDEATHLCAVLFVDLNGFKSINDTYGHAAGDRVLRAVAERLRDSVLGSDLSARLGGDEFAVLLTGLDDEAGAVSVARRISAAIGSPLLVAGQVLVPSASIGVVVADPRDCEAGVLLHRSDVAMYHAKRSGAPWIVYHPDLEVMSLTRPADEPPAAFDAREAH